MKSETTNSKNNSLLEGVDCGKNIWWVNMAVLIHHAIKQGRFRLIKPGVIAFAGIRLFKINESCIALEMENNSGRVMLHDDLTVREVDNYIWKEQESHNKSLARMATKVLEDALRKF